ncbi:MAG TPA: hypothetical protein VLI39_21115 [Sedimentisphaerales bacterium]|nr:hypothetical protein [Sedimentisphaerales bacterium]
MCTQRNIVISTITVLVLLLSTTVWTVFGGGAAAPGNTYESSIIQGEGLEWSAAGPWLCTVPTPAGPIFMYHVMYPLDSAGKRYSGVLWEVNDDATGFGAFPEADQALCWMTLTVRTGPDTFETTMVRHSTKKGTGPLRETVHISIGNCTWRLTGPNSNEGEATVAQYLPAQDADGDGFPDEGQEPVLCVPFTVTSKRLTMMPGCVPTPMPEAPKP